MSKPTLPQLNVSNVEVFTAKVIAVRVIAVEATEAITVEAITFEVIAVELIAVEDIAVELIAGNVIIAQDKGYHGQGVVKVASSQAWSSQSRLLHSGPSTASQGYQKYGIFTNTLLVQKT